MTGDRRKIEEEVTYTLYKVSCMRKGLKAMFMFAGLSGQCMILGVALSLGGPHISPYGGNGLMEEGYFDHRLAIKCRGDGICRCRSRARLHSTEVRGLGGAVHNHGTS